MYKSLHKGDDDDDENNNNNNFNNSNIIALKALYCTVNNICNVSIWFVSQ